MALRPFRSVPANVKEWERWMNAQSVRAEDDSSFSGNLEAANFVRGEGSPEGKVTALPGALYTDIDGGASATLYVKESGDGKYGWIAK